MVGGVPGGGWSGGEVILHSKLRVGVWSCIKVCTGVGDANTHREVGYKRALELSGMGSGGRQQERPSKVASAGVSVEATEGNGYHKEACCWSFPRWFPGGRTLWKLQREVPGEGTSNGRGRDGAAEAAAQTIAGLISFPSPGLCLLVSPHLRVSHAHSLLNSLSRLCIYCIVYHLPQERNCLADIY